MTLQLGDTVPDFTQESQLGPINLYDFAGVSWVVLFSHPADYTPVCATELGAVAKLPDEFAKRNTKDIFGLNLNNYSSGRGRTSTRTYGISTKTPAFDDIFWIVRSERTGG